jgi:nitrate reductase gamma subunit
VGPEAVSAATKAAGSAAGAVQGAVEAVSAASAEVPRTGFALVLDKAEYAVLVPLVYLAFAFFAAMTIARLAKLFRAPLPGYSPMLFPERRKPALAAIGESLGMAQIRKLNPVFWVFLAAYHIAFVLLILGHLDILPWINILSPESRHMLGAGTVGLGVTLPVLYFLFRRLKGETRRISAPGDYLLLALLLFLFLFGDLMSWGNSWTANGFVMTKADFALYFDSLAKFSFADPRVVLHGSHYHFVVIHVLLAEAFLCVLPFSKVIHAFLSIPVNALRRVTWTKR